MIGTGGSGGGTGNDGVRMPLPGVNGYSGANILETTGTGDRWH